DPVVNVVPDVLLVGQHLVDGGPRPLAALTRIQNRRDLCLVAPLVDEEAVDPTNDVDLLDGARDQGHAIRLDALVLPPRKDALRVTCLIDEHSAKAESGGAALPEADLNQAALTLEDLGGELAAVLARHRALDGLDDGRADGPVVRELLGAVLHRDAGFLARVLVESALIGILEPPPAADVVDQDRREVGVPGPHDIEDLFERVAALDAQAALPGIRECADDLHVVLC